MNKDKQNQSECCEECLVQIVAKNLSPDVAPRQCLNSFCKCHTPTEPEDQKKDSWEERVDMYFTANDKGGDGFAHLNDYDRKKIKTFVTKVKQQTIAEIVEKIEGMKKGHGSIVQLMVNDQGTTEGKLHYQREYGKKDGYNQALQDLKTLLTKE